MNRFAHGRILLSGLAAAGLLAPLAHAASPAAPARPNVVLIMVDDLNNFVGAYGGHPQARTPHIDRLAREGTLFRRAYSNGGWCVPSRASLFSGLGLPTIGFPVDFLQNPRLTGSRTLMEHLRANGYHVAGAGKLTHPDHPPFYDEFGPRTNYGPSAFDGREARAHSDMPAAFAAIDASGTDGSFSPLERIPSHPPTADTPGATGWYDRNRRRIMRYVDDRDRDPLPDELTARWFEDFLARRAKAPPDQPFYAGVGIVRPHTPLHVPQRFFDLFPLESIQLPPILDGDIDDTAFVKQMPPNHRGTFNYRGLIDGFGPDRDAALRLYIRAYLAAVAFADEQVGHVLAALDRSPFATNTVVILASDHGYLLGPKDWLFKNGPWDQTLQIPLVVRAPGLSAPGAVVEPPVSLLDVYPTLVELCALAGDTRKNADGRPLEGRSLVPLLRGGPLSPEDRERVALTVLAADPQNRGATSRQNNYSLRTTHWRYVRCHNGGEELYDHRVDPREERNLAADPAHAPIKNELLLRLRPLMAPEDRARLDPS